MTAPRRASRVRRARWPGMCPLCRGPILIGQQIGKTGFWAHTSCIIDRRTMGTVTDLPRCTERSCAWRWRTGPDRPCATHADDGADLWQRMDAFGAAMAEAPGAPEAIDGAASRGGNGVSRCNPVVLPSTIRGHFRHQVRP